MKLITISPVKSYTKTIISLKENSKNLIYSSDNFEIFDTPLNLKRGDENYKINIKEKYIKVGCQTLSIEQVKQIINELLDIKIISNHKIKYIVLKDKNKISHNSPILLEESTSFYISTSNRSYLKEKYKIIEDFEKIKPLLKIYKTWAENYIKYNGYWICKNTVKNRKILADKLIELLSIYSYIENLKDLENQE